MQGQHAVEVTEQAIVIIHLTRHFYLKVHLDDDLCARLQSRRQWHTHSAVIQFVDRFHTPTVYLDHGHCRFPSEYVRE